MTLIMALVSEVLTFFGVSTGSFRMAKRAFSFFSYPSDEMQASTGGWHSLIYLSMKDSEFVVAGG